MNYASRVQLGQVFETPSSISTETPLETNGCAAHQQTEPGHPAMHWAGAQLRKQKGENTFLVFA